MREKSTRKPRIFQALFKAPGQSHDYSMSLLEYLTRVTRNGSIEAYTLGLEDRGVEGADGVSVTLAVRRKEDEGPVNSPLSSLLSTHFTLWLFNVACARADGSVDLLRPRTHEVRIK